MNMIQLKDAVEGAIEHAKECGVDPATVNVALQVDCVPEGAESAYSTENVELIYDNNGMAGGCVLYGFHS